MMSNTSRAVWDTLKAPAPVMRKAMSGTCIPACTILVWSFLLVLVDVYLWKYSSIKKRPRLVDSIVKVVSNELNLAIMSRLHCFVHPPAFTKDGSCDYRGLLY
jgi:hypothetical protein